MGYDYLGPDNRTTVNTIYVETTLDEAWWATIHPDGNNAWLSDVGRFSGNPDAPRAGDLYEFAYGNITNRSLIAEVEPPRRLVLNDTYRSHMADDTFIIYHLRTTYSLEPTPEGIR